MTSLILYQKQIAFSVKGQNNTNLHGTRANCETKQPADDKQVTKNKSACVKLKGCHLPVQQGSLCLYENQHSQENASQAADPSSGLSAARLKHTLLVLKEMC